MPEQKPNERHNQTEANKTEMTALSERNNRRTDFFKGKRNSSDEIHDRNCLGISLTDAREYTNRKRRAMPSAN